jgi:UDP-N-acetylmuramate--alanine ligase
MEMISLQNIKKAHFIGIGGIGMSGLARLFLHEGKIVSGSDRAPSDITNALVVEGVTFFATQEAANISADTDMFIYTEAMSEDHPEMIAARELGVPMVNYFEALGLVANEYYLIAVAGTHGKTTTTAMLIDIFEEAGLDPTAIVGSLRSKTKSNFRAGKSKYFIVEACEYRRDFLHLEPDVLVITNIEAEHLDYYKDLNDVQSAFHELARKVPADGVVIAQATNPLVQPVLEGLSCKVIDYKEQLDLSLSLKMPGLHNRMNAAAARAAALEVGIQSETINTALQNFSGTWRRFEYKGELNGAPVYDDYAHHPTEIAATIAGLRELYPEKRIVAVFQPHLRSRTAELFDDFIAALSKADLPIITKIYDARNTGKDSMTVEVLMEAIKKVNPHAIHHETFDDVTSELKKTVNSDDTVVIMGAGDVAKVPPALTQ